MNKEKIYNWLTRNSKMRKSSGVKIYNWGIPAYKSATGFKTCPKAGVCAIGCYATMGAYKFSNVAAVFEKRLTLSQSDSFVQAIDAEIKRRKVMKLRIHDSGDFYSLEYILKWRKIMWLNPDVEFYAYTKMVRLFKALQSRGTLPVNFTLIYSYGGIEDSHINTETDRHARVFQSTDKLAILGYVDASADDTLAVGKNKKIGLIYHGTKGYNKTNWKYADAR